MWEHEQYTVANTSQWIEWMKVLNSAECMRLIEQSVAWWLRVGKCVCICVSVCVLISVVLGIHVCSCCVFLVSGVCGLLWRDTPLYLYLYYLNSCSILKFTECVLKCMRKVQWHFAVPKKCHCQNKQSFRQTVLYQCFKVNESWSTSVFVSTCIPVLKNIQQSKNNQL